MPTITSYTKDYVDDLEEELKLLICNRQTDDYTLVLADAQKCIEMDCADADTLTVPNNTSVAFPIGTVIYVVQRGAGAIDIAPGGSVTLRSLDGNLTIAGQYGMAKLHKIDTNEWYLTGDLITPP